MRSFCTSSFTIPVLGGKHKVSHVEFIKMCSASTTVIATCCVLVAISLLYHHLQKPYCPAHNVVAKVLENNLFFQMPGLTTKQDDQEFCTAFNLKQTLTDSGSNSTVARIKEFAGKALHKLHFRVPHISFC